MKITMQYIKIPSSGNIIIHVDNGMKRTININKNTFMYKEIAALLEEIIESSSYQKDLSITQAQYDALTKLTNNREVTKYTMPNIRIEGSHVYFKDVLLDDVVSRYIIDYLDSTNRFISEAVVQNMLNAIVYSRSPHVKERLFRFIMKNDIYLSKDGKSVLAWRVCSPAYKDKYSGKFDNSIGAVCEVPPGAVNIDPNQYCSAGLHVCSFDYLPSYASEGDPVLVVKVDIEDILSIPFDYDGSKIRCCRFEVLDEIGKWSSTFKQEHSNTSLAKYGFHIEGEGAMSLIEEEIANEDHIQQMLSSARSSFEDNDYEDDEDEDDDYDYDSSYLNDEEEESEEDDDYDYDFHITFRRNDDTPDKEFIEAEKSFRNFMMNDLNMSSDEADEVLKKLIG